MSLSASVFACYISLQTNGSIVTVNSTRKLMHVSSMYILSYSKCVCDSKVGYKQQYLNMHALLNKQNKSKNPITIIIKHLYFNFQNSALYVTVCMSWNAEIVLFSCLVSGTFVSVLELCN
jgi:hypothetical protein